MMFQEWKADMNSESLFPLWARLGVNFPAFEPSSEEPLVEELIAYTSIIGRYEPRLIEGMAGWIEKHGALINTSLMRKHISIGDSAVIGLLFDILNSKESFKLKHLMNYCTPKPKAQMLFYAAEQSSVMKAQAIENESDVNKHWNLYFVSLRIKTEAVIARKEVLKRNPNLARRALFGVEMRTEILNYLLNRGVSFPAEIAKNLGYRYHRVNEDIQVLIKEGAIIDSAKNSKRELKISPSFQEYLNIIPF